MKIIQDICFSFPEVSESPHFHKSSFRVKKKIFATLDTQKSDLVVKLSLVDQSVFSDMLSGHVYPVPGKWGTKGWTIVQYTQLKEEVLEDILKTAFKEVAPTRLANQLDELDQ